MPRSLGLLTARLGLIGAAAVLGWLAFGGPGRGLAIPPSPLFATATIQPVNVVSLRLRADIGWGLLWLGMLYVPFRGHDHGRDGAALRRRRPGVVPPLPLQPCSPLAVVAVATFTPLNAPVE